ncbi:MAG TPA: hypothetical protein VHO70_17430, partial [Chitinispirillaceae bacterium]|nr:hypothetical protein [Chitinispirillaceae bacterium]
MKKRASIEGTNQSGAVLVTLILTMVIFTVISGGMLYFFSTSSHGELLANRQQRAYYMGESGANYALQQFLANPVANGPFPSPVTFTVGSDQITVKTYDKSTDSTHLIIESTGIVGTGWLATRQLVTKDIKKATAVPPGMPPATTDDSGVAIGFNANDTTQQDGVNPLDNSWELATGTETDDVDITADDSLMFKGTEAAINLNTSVVDLVEAWNSNGELLSYFLQVKVDNSKMSPGKYYMIGLSFRIMDDAAATSFGLSFYRFDGDSCNYDWCMASGFVSGIRSNANLAKDGTIYVILWKKLYGNYTLLASAPMPINSTYGIIASDGTLAPWTTLFIRVNERFDGTDGARRNHLKAYVQSASLYPKDTTNWSVSSLKPVTWTFFTSPSSSTEVIDDTPVLTSKDFNASRPEIGVHAFYDSS